jgi:hypothetical protein
MTDTPSEALVEAPVQATEPAPSSEQPKKAGRSQAVQPVLEKLFELYPHLFGAEFLPLKLGVFQELLASHPEHFARDTLKAALGTHTRSTRYLQSVAAGKQRHDLQGAAVEPVSPEHVYLALVELFSRRQGRSTVDLRPKLRAQVVAAFEASGLTREAYLDRVQVVDTQGGALLEDAFAEYDQAQAKQEALCRAFKSSGQTIEAFADMYGLNVRDVAATLEQHQLRQPS